MIKNYLKIALRHLGRHKGYAVINVLGLALGIACCLLILLFVQDELRYDRFHDNADRIVRLAVETESGDRTFQYPSVGGGWAQAFIKDVPDVEQAARLLKPFGGSVWLVKDDERFREQNLMWVDSTVFDVFTFEFIEGDPATALMGPHRVVLTETAAQKYFGTTDIVGQTLGIEFAPDVVDLQITGVIKDVPDQSHFHFDLLGSIPTLREQFGPNANQFLTNYTVTAFYTYLLLSKDTEIAELEAQVPAVFQQYTSDQDREFVQSLFIQPLTDIHLHSRLLNEIETNSNIAYIYIFSAIALLTLIIACINFMNLATARSANRAREVGMRKVLGAERSDLVGQFLGESMLLAILALIVGVAIAALVLPVFNNLAGKSLGLSTFADPLIVTVLLGITLFVGIFSGSYPALYLSAFRPVTVLKGTFQASGGTTLRKALVVTQFAVSIIFLVCSAIIYNQIDFIRNAPAGFERAQRMVVPLPLPPDERERVVDLLKREYEQHPNIMQVAAASNVPGQLRGINRVRTDAMQEGEFQEAVTVDIDHNYIETMGIEVLDGRAFDANRSTDSTEAFMLNEAAVELLGLSDPVGAEVEWRTGIQDNQNTEVIQGRVIGVYKNLHFEPMYREISPMLFRINPPNYFTIVAEVSPERVSETVSFMEQTWLQVVSNRPFLYSFLDDDLNEIYQGEQNLSDVVRYVTFLAIFIACLGLFGLASFMTMQRTKEIGVRKVLGASVPGIVMLLSKEFAALVGLAFIIAVPVSYFAMAEWLDKFVYHTTIGPVPFLLAGGATLLIAWLTVSYQSIKAALSNPVKALRSE
ncbi:MAG TPA: ABC transporter permease [Rhodothermales bacterium]|nr:ABC transporter permease [Rhodothermales bacterium]